MKLKIEMELDNQAFENPKEVRNVLQNMLSTIEGHHGSEIFKSGMGGGLKDTNGNFVGIWSIRK